MDARRGAHLAARRVGERRGLRPGRECRGRPRPLRGDGGHHRAPARAARHDVQRPGRSRRRAGLRRRHDLERLRPRDRGPQRARGPGHRGHRVEDRPWTSPTRTASADTSSTTTPGSSAATPARSGSRPATRRRRTGRSLSPRRGETANTCLASVLGTWDDTGWACTCSTSASRARVGGGATRLPPVRAQTVADRLTVLGLPASTRDLTSRHRRGDRRSPRAPTAGLTRTTNHRRRPRGSPPRRRRPRPPVRRRRTRPRPEPARPPPPRWASDDGRTLGSVLRTAGFVLLGLLVVVVLLRRRAVKRRRARRIERMRALAEARRRGMIDVVEPDDAGHPAAAEGTRSPRRGGAAPAPQRPPGRPVGAAARPLRRQDRGPRRGRRADTSDPPHERPAPATPEVLYDVDGHIATITLNRPHRRNAISVRMLVELCATSSSASNATAAVRVAILTGAGVGFCAGLDIKDAIAGTGIGGGGNDGPDGGAGLTRTASCRPLRCTR